MGLRVRDCDMGDLFYNTVWHIAHPVFWMSSRPIVIGARHTDRRGAYILAAGNHQSPYDVPLLMRHCARNIDFVSIREVFQKPLVAWFYSGMNAFPLDRSRPDPTTVRTILDRLKKGRVVGMFPEGRFRRGRESVLLTGKIQPGIGRIAKMAQAPIVPCVILNSAAYSRPASWVPGANTRYAIAFAEPLADVGDAEEVEARLVRAFAELHAALTAQGVKSTKGNGSSGMKERSLSPRMDTNLHE